MAGKVEVVGSDGLRQRFDREPVTAGLAVDLAEKTETGGVRGSARQNLRANDLGLSAVAPVRRLGSLRPSGRRCRTGAERAVSLVARGGGPTLSSVHARLQSQSMLERDSMSALLPPATSFAKASRRACCRRRSPVTRNRRKRATHFGGNRLRLDALRIAGIAGHPHPRLEAFDRERPGLGEPMLDLEARTAAFDELGLDRDVVAEPRRLSKTRPRSRPADARRIRRP